MHVCVVGELRFDSIEELCFWACVELPFDISVGLSWCCSVDVWNCPLTFLCLCDFGENCPLKLCRLKGGYSVSGGFILILYAEMVVFVIFVELKN